MARHARWLRACWALAALGGCDAGTNQSGQTGSPEGDAPPFQSPAPVESGGEIVQPNGPGGAGTPYIVPRAPRRPRAKVLGDTLITAEGRWLSLFDVRDAQRPVLAARLEQPGDVALLAADTLGRVVVTVTASERYSGPEIPERMLSYSMRRVVEIDATNPSQPIVGRSFELSADVAAVVPTATGYTLLGGDIEYPEAGCGIVNQLELLPSQRDPVVSGLWLERIDDSHGELRPGARRELETGHFQLANDGAHVVRIGMPFMAPTHDFDLELIELATLATSFSARVALAELGGLPPNQDGAPVFVDHRDGIVLLSGWPRVLGWDARKNVALAGIAGTSAPLTFIGADLASDANGLVRIDRSSSPARVEAIPAPRSGSPTGWVVTGLEPFGDGYISIAATADPNDTRLLASRFALTADDRLELVEQLQPGWPFHTDWVYGSRWSVDGEHARVSFSAPLDDVPQTRIGLLALQDGKLLASSLVTVEQHSLELLIHDDAVLSVSEQRVETLAIEASTGAVALSPEASLPVALTHVRAEIVHGGLTFTIQRADTGERTLSVRKGDLSSSRVLNLTHVPDVVVPVDENHVAVLGLSVPGVCDTLSDGPECAPGRKNGVSILRIDGTTAAPVASLPLSSTMEGAAPSGIFQSLNFSGYFRASPTRWAILGGFLQECASVSDCQKIGVAPGSEPEVYGSRSETRLFSLDLADPAHPKLSPSARLSTRLRFGEPYLMDVGPSILEAWDGSARAFAVEEPIYDAAGNSLTDAHGRALNRYAIQFLDSDAPDIAFGDEVTIPGALVALASNERAFSLQTSYRANGTPYLRLHRLHLSHGDVSVEQSLDIGGLVAGYRAAGDRLALIRAPQDVCAPESSYEVVVAHLDAARLTLSEPLILENPVQGNGWAFVSEAPPLNEPGHVALEGGPALGRGRLVLDVTQSPPAIVRYETFEW